MSAHHPVLHKPDNADLVDVPLEVPSNAHPFDFHAAGL